MTNNTDMSAIDEEPVYSDEDLFANDSNDCVVTLTSSVSYEDEYQSLLFHNRDRIISKLKHDLSNVLPPPPTVTTCRLSVNEMLERWYKYENSTFPTKKIETKELKNIDRAKNWSWPEVAKVQCFDVYYNIDNKSTEMALLETKYQQRYVSNETKSLMNTGNTPQTKKERSLIRETKPVEQNTRLIRRKPVSKPQLLAEAKARLALVENKRQILVPGKLKRDYIKPLEKSHLENKNSSVGSTGHKRALFQSPETRYSGKRLCYRQNTDSEEISEPLSAQSICSDTSNTTPVKRWSVVTVPLDTPLFGNEKKIKSQVNTEPVRKCHRALKFCNATESITPVNLFNTKPKPRELSRLHKQKLLWAISEVLKSCGIDSHHKQFRPFLQQLFKVCSKQWLQLPRSDVKTSTSESMRDMVMKHKNTVLKLKSTSPIKSGTKNEDYGVSKQKSVSDVRKVLFTDNTPKSNFEFKQCGSEIEIKGSTIKSTTCVSERVKDFSVFLDVKKLPVDKNSEDQSNGSISSTSDYFSNLDIDSKDSEAISVG